MILRAFICSFAVIVAMSAPAWAGPIGYSIRSEGDGQLYRIDLGTGVVTAVGPTGLGPDADVEGLAFQPGTGTLFGYDEFTDELVTINLTTGAGTVVGTTPAFLIDPGLAFTSDGTLYVAGFDPFFVSDDLWTLDPTDADGDFVGFTDTDVRGLAALERVMNCTRALGVV